MQPFLRENDLNILSKSLRADDLVLISPPLGLEAAGLWGLEKNLAISVRDLF